MNNESVNPWLGEIIMDFRRSHYDDEGLRKGYRDYIKSGSKYYYWGDYVGRCALESYVQEHPRFLMPCSKMPFPQHTRDLLNHLMVYCLSDLMQLTVEELDVLFDDKEEQKLISQFLADNNLHLYSHKGYTYKLSIESIDRARKQLDDALSDMIDRAKLVFSDYDKDGMNLSNFRDVIEMFEQADSFADQYDCGVDVRKRLYHEYASIMEMKFLCFDDYEDHAIKVVKRLLYYVAVTGNHFMEKAECYMIMGNLYFGIGNHPEALELYDIALKVLFDEPAVDGRNGWISRVYCKMGECYRDLKENDKAIGSYLKAIDYSEDLPFSDSEYNKRVFHILAELFESIGDKEKADNYHILADDENDNDPNESF